MRTPDEITEMLRNMRSEVLVDKCRKWIENLCNTGGQAWTLRVPPDPARDPDLLFSELCRRVSLLNLVEQVIEAAQRVTTYNRQPAKFKLGDVIIYTGQNLKAHPFHRMTVEGIALVSSIENSLPHEYWLYKCVHHDPATGISIPKFLTEPEIQPEPTPSLETP